MPYTPDELTPEILEKGRQLEELFGVNPEDRHLVIEMPGGSGVLRGEVAEFLARCSKEIPDPMTEAQENFYTNLIGMGIAKAKASKT